MWRTYRCHWARGEVSGAVIVSAQVQALIKRDWIATIPSWPEQFDHQPMKETALKVSEELRDPDGEHRVDIIIALTHCRVTNVSE